MHPVLMWSERLLDYDFGPGHPMDPVRLDLTIRLMAELGLLERFDVVAPRLAGAALDAADMLAGGGVRRVLSLAGGMHHAMPSAAGRGNSVNLALAEEHGGGRWLALGGGGYDVVGVVPRVWAHVAAVVAGVELDPAQPTPPAWRRHVRETTGRSRRATTRRAPWIGRSWPPGTPRSRASDSIRSPPEIDRRSELWSGSVSGNIRGMTACAARVHAFPSRKLEHHD